MPIRNFVRLWLLIFCGVLFFGFFLLSAFLFGNSSLPPSDAPDRFAVFLPLLVLPVFAVTACLSLGGWVRGACATCFSGIFLLIFISFAREAGPSLGFGTAYLLCSVLLIMMWLKAVRPLDDSAANGSYLYMTDELRERRERPANL